MKNPFLFILLFIVAIGYSQSHGISYQAVLLNPKGEELLGKTIVIHLFWIKRFVCVLRLETQPINWNTKKQLVRKLILLGWLI
jgi:hypothetical protein